MFRRCKRFSAVAVSITSVSLMAIFVIMAVSLPFVWKTSKVQADLYNKLCAPKVPITSSEVFWAGGIDVSKCNMNVKVSK